MKFLVYKSEKFDPYWMPSKILFLNWFLLTSWILGVFFLIFNLTFVKNIDIFIILGVTLIFSGFITGYLSCLTDIGDHPPAGIKWGIFNGIYLSLGFLILNLIIPDLHISLNILNLAILFIFAMIFSGFFGIIGRFHHEININLRMENYDQIKKPRVLFIFITMISFLILYYLTIIALIIPSYNIERLSFLLIPNLWLIIKIAYLILLFYYITIWLIFLIDLFKKKFFKDFSKLDIGIKITNVVILGLPIISIILILSILPQLLIPTYIDTLGNVVIGQGLWNTSYGIILVNYLGILFIILKLAYEIEIIDYKLYNRAN